MTSKLKEALICKVRGSLVCLAHSSVGVLTTGRLAQEFNVCTVLRGRGGKREGCFVKVKVKVKVFGLFGLVSTEMSTRPSFPSRPVHTETMISIP